MDLLPERLELDDGDFIDLVWSQYQDRPVVLILHGLEGSANSHYVPGLIHQLEQHGYCPVLMHFRGCSGVPNRLIRSYHSGDTGDMATVVDYIGNKTGRPVFAAIGFSLGGNALLKWLGQSGSDNPLSRAIAVSVPFVLNDAAKRLEQGLSRLYQRHLLKSLRRSYLDKFEQLQSPLDVDVNSLHSFRAFDDEVTAPLHGFNGVDHYYSESSSRQYLAAIKTKTLIIHAIDDPFMFPETPPTESEISDNVELVLTDKGGHVGFVTGRYPWKAEYWHETVIIDFLGK
jgi:predicted alpha/beta-fold hydrolase